MKPSDDLKVKYQLYTGKDAQTVDDIAKESGLGLTTVRAFARKMVEQKIWRRVFVKKNNAIIPAYIKIKGQ